MKLLHVGVNCADSREAARVAQRFAAVLDLEYRPGPASDFAGTLVETTRGDGRGTHGHIAIGVDHVARAVRILEGRGIEFDAASAKLDGKGQVRVIYLKEEIGGFAIHLGRNS